MTKTHPEGLVEIDKVFFKIHNHVFPLCRSRFPQNAGIKGFARTHMNRFHDVHDGLIGLRRRVIKHQLIGCVKVFLGRHAKDMIDRDKVIFLAVASLRRYIFFAREIGPKGQQFKLVLDRVDILQVIGTLAQSPHQHPGHILGQGHLHQARGYFPHEFRAGQQIAALLLGVTAGAQYLNRVGVGIHQLYRHKPIDLGLDQDHRGIAQVQKGLGINRICVGGDNIQRFGAGQFPGMTQLVDGCLGTLRYSRVGDLFLGSVHHHQRQAVIVGSFHRFPVQFVSSGGTRQPKHRGTEH